MKTKKKIFERYEHDDKGYIIKISTNYFRELFNKFDRTSSFLKRDLDYDLADYLFESATDLEGREFYISINLHAEEKTEEFESKVNKGIDSYFEYESHKIERKKKHVAHKILLHIILAIASFFLSYTLDKVIISESFLYVLFVESLVIAAWVLLWPVFSDFIYELSEVKQTIKIYKKLIDAEIQFTYLR